MRFNLLPVQVTQANLAPQVSQDYLAKKENLVSRV